MLPGTVAGKDDSLQVGALRVSVFAKRYNRTELVGVRRRVGTGVALRHSAESPNAPLQRVVRIQIEEGGSPRSGADTRSRLAYQAPSVCR